MRSTSVSKHSARFARTCAGPLHTTSYPCLWLLELSSQHLVSLSHPPSQVHPIPTAVCSLCMLLVCWGVNCTLDPVTSLVCAVGLLAKTVLERLLCLHRRSSHGLQLPSSDGQLSAAPADLLHPLQRCLTDRSARNCALWYHNTNLGDAPLPSFSASRDCCCEASPELWKPIVTALACSSWSSSDCCLQAAAMVWTAKCMYICAGTDQE